MEIKKGTLVACNMYGFHEGRISPPNEKNSLGIIIEQNGSENGLRSFRVKFLHPESLKERAFGVLEKDLVPLAQTDEKQFDVVRDNLVEIILSLVRRSDTLERQVRYLKEANKAL